MTKTWFVDGQIIEETIPEAKMNTNRSGNLHEIMHQAAWDSATRVPEGDIRALKHRIHELEGEVIGYKQILDEQSEQAGYVKKKEWVGLTTEEMDDIYFCVEGGRSAIETWREQVEAVEAKLKEKNNG